MNKSELVPYVAFSWTLTIFKSHLNLVILGFVTGLGLDNVIPNLVINFVLTRSDLQFNSTVVELWRLNLIDLISI